MDNTTQEREDLEQLVTSAGWQRFITHVRREWGDDVEGGGVMFMNATRAALQGSDEQSLAHLRQMAAAQREIHRAIAWVYGTLKTAQKAEASGPTPVVPMFQRRGGL